MFTVHTGFIPVNILLLLQTNCFIITSYNIIYTYIQWLLLRRVEYLFPFFNSFSENWHFKRYQIFLFRLIFYKKWDFFYSLTFRNFTWVHLNLLKKLSDRYYYCYFKITNLDIKVIGGGSGGIASARRAAEYNVKVNSTCVLLFNHTVFIKYCLRLSYIY